MNELLADLFTALFRGCGMFASLFLGYAAFFFFASFFDYEPETRKEKKRQRACVYSVLIALLIGVGYIKSYVPTNAFIANDLSIPARILYYILSGISMLTITIMVISHIHNNTDRR